MLYQKCTVRKESLCETAGDRNLAEDFTAGVTGTAEVWSILLRKSGGVQPVKPNSRT